MLSFCPTMQVLMSSVVSTVIAFVAGALWHSKYAFGKKWEEYHAKKASRKEECHATMPFIMFLAICFMQAVLFGVLTGEYITNVCDGLVYGSAIGFVFLGGPLITSGLFSNESKAMLFIKPGYYVLCALIFGLVLGLFRANAWCI